MSNFELIVLSRLARGPRYARSFQRLLPLVSVMVDRGFIARVAPPGGTGRNMLALTEAGERRLMLIQDAARMKERTNAIEEGIEPKDREF